MQMLLKSSPHIDCWQACRVPGIMAVVDSKHDFDGVEARMPRTGDSLGGRAPGRRVAAGIVVGMDHKEDRVGGLSMTR